MTFVQLIDCKTDHADDVNRLMDRWVGQTQGRRTATHSVIGRDRADEHHVIEIVEFPSYEEAMRNSALPETDRIFQELVALCDEPPRFTDLDVIRDEQLNKAAVLNFFERVAPGGDVALVDELFAADYLDHDPANPEETRGPAGVRRQLDTYRSAFDMQITVDDQVAEGDEVCTRWTARGTHVGEFMGLPATGRRFEFSGLTVHHFRDGKIKEAWWGWDTLGLLRQLGILES